MSTCGFHTPHVVGLPVTSTRKKSFFTMYATESVTSAAAAKRGASLSAGAQGCMRATHTSSAVGAAVGNEVMEECD